MTTKTKKAEPSRNQGLIEELGTETKVRTHRLNCNVTEDLGRWLAEVVYEAKLQNRKLTQTEIVEKALGDLRGEESAAQFARKFAA